MKLPSFKIYGGYFNWHNWSNVEEFSWSTIFLGSTIIRHIRNCGRAATAKKCIKWHDAGGTIAFLTFSLLSPSWTVSNHEGDRGGENIAQKVNSCCFKFHHTNLGESRQIKEKKVHFGLTCVAQKNVAA